MKFFNIDEATSQFLELVDQAAAGEEIIIAKDGKPMAKLIPLEKKPPVVIVKQPPQAAYRSVLTDCGRFLPLVPSGHPHG